MLVLSRRPGEKVIIGGCIILTVVAVSGKQVRVSIDAPKQVSILRAELSAWQNGSPGKVQPDPDLEVVPTWSQDQRCERE